MKQLLFILLVPFFGMSQTQWDYLGGLPIHMQSAVDACMFFDFEQNGSNEVKIVHGDDVGCYFTSTTSTPIYTQTHKINGVDFWSDCDPKNFFEWTSDTAWIMKGNTRLSSGSHVLPFKYGSTIGFFVLKLTTGSDTLKVRGYKFSIDPRNFECYNLRPWTQNIEPKSFKDYNHMGFPVDEYYSGLVIRVYESGETTKIVR